MTGKREEVDEVIVKVLSEHERKMLKEHGDKSYNIVPMMGQLADKLTDALLERFDIQPYCDCERPDVACTDRIVQKIHEMVCVTCGRIGRAREEGKI